MSAAPPTAVEARTGLDPWQRAELPAPPWPRGLAWIGVVGPGVIILGGSIGSGEFLLGPAVFVEHGLSLLWITLVAIVLQTILNTEVMRYVLATGEPVFTGYMRTWPSARGWAWFYGGVFLLQFGWPAWAATSAAALYFVWTGRLPGAADAQSVYLLGVATFLVCVAILLLGRRIVRTLELLNWIMVAVTLIAFALLALALVPGRTWLAALVGFTGYDLLDREWTFLPADADFFLIAALAGYAGGGGLINIALGNWARDKGYGMSAHAGYIAAAAAGGERVRLAHSGFTFAPDERSMRHWRGWWRIVRADQWGVFCCGALLGMALPALLYVSFLPPGTDIRGLGISVALAEAVGRQVAPWLAVVLAILGAWLLFKTQLDLLDAMTRTITDILWSGSPGVRRFRGGDARALYYCVLGVIVAWGIVALGLAQPIVLLQLSANIGGIAIMIASLHLLRLNTRLLPAELRPPLWRRAALVAIAVFYGFFAVLSVSSLVRAAA